MKCHTLLIVRVFVLVFGMVSQAEIKIIVEHNSNEDATSTFQFKNIPAPSGFDAANQAAFSIVDGERDANDGDGDKLHDGRVPTEDLWKDYTGRTVQELGDEWRSDHEKRLAGGDDAKTDPRTDAKP